MKKQDKEDVVDETASTTTSGNAGSYTRPIGYTSKSIPVLVDNFIARFEQKPAEDSDEE